MDPRPDAPVGHETTATRTAETSALPAKTAALPTVTTALPTVTATLPTVMAPAEPGMRPTGRRATAGVTIALTAPGSSGGDHLVRQYAGNLVAITKVPGHTGLDWGQAFAAITSAMIRM